MIVKCVYELFFFTLNFSLQGRPPQVQALFRCMQQPKPFWGCTVGCVHTKLVEVLPGRQNSGQKNEDFTHALVLENHAEWPKLNHNTFLLKSIGLFSSQELSFAAPRVLPFSLHRCGFIVSLLCCLCRLGAPANLKHLRVLRVLCGHNFFCKASNILSSDDDRLVIFL